MTEAELRGRVLELCGRIGLLVHYTPDSRTAIGAGFPDLVIAGVFGVLFAELKSADGGSSADQDMWAWFLSAIGRYDWNTSLYYLWRPADLESGEIERVLTQLTRPVS